MIEVHLNNRRVNYTNYTFTHKSGEVFKVNTHEAWGVARAMAKRHFRSMGLTSSDSDIT